MCDTQLTEYIGVTVEEDISAGIVLGPHTYSNVCSQKHLPI